jgi:molybdopterin molybdotransferase
MHTNIQGREDASMLSIDDAREIVLAETKPGRPRLGDELLPLSGALDRVLAQDVIALGSVPSFDNSAMDGYAVRSGPAQRRLAIVDESRAGTPARATVGPGEAIRISNGAMLPIGADAVVQSERVNVDGKVVIPLVDVHPGENVRRIGDDLVAGRVVLEAGRRMGPVEIGSAATAGVGELRCALRPRVAIVATGDELTDPGASLGPGEIYESNSLSLAALARRAGADVGARRRARDTPQAVREAIGAALDEADVVVLSGGVSVGPHDHVKPALEALGVREAFWRVAVRPGRPIWFGVRDRDRTLVFGLPGNPVSAVVTFILFARPAINALQGAQPYPPRGRAVMSHDIDRHPDRDECVRVRIAAGQATSTGPQDSHILSSLLDADGLAIVTRGAGVLAAGEPVEIESL